MSAADPPSLIVCGAQQDEIDAAARAIAAAVSLPVHTQRAGDTSFEWAGCRACVVVGATGGELGAALSARPEHVRLVIVDGRDAERLAADCRFKTLPSAKLLTALLAELARELPPQPRSWRRKSDMIIGNSPAITELRRLLDRLAVISSPVLVTGESGTGKELVAQALHFSGVRSHARFVAINCAAVPEALCEAELFGYERGAFTGAVTAHEGLFEAAHGGTLFLDEIGDMPLPLQAKLLRVLETGDVTRLGSTVPRHVDARIVTATNRDLEEHVASGRFRQDLYYRIRVCHVQVVPLRERREDIVPLTTHHLHLIAEREHRPPPTLSRGAFEKLLMHGWPGNVRELINALERAFALSQPGAILAEHIVLPTETSSTQVRSYREAREEFDARYYRELLRAAGGNVSLVAKLSNRTRAQVYEALRRLRLEPDRFRVG